jgi:hypothetical protein
MTARISVLSAGRPLPPGRFIILISVKGWVDPWAIVRPEGWHCCYYCHFLKRGNYATVSNYRPISVLNNFSNLFELIIYDHVLHYAKFNRNQCDFIRTTSAVTNLVTIFLLFHLFYSCVVRCQRQADTLFFRSFKCFWLCSSKYDPGRVKNFLFSSSRPALGSTQPLV